MGDADPDLALSCPICMEPYSDTRYPIAPYCGHSICKECGDKRKSNQCVSCTEHCFYDVTNKTSPWPSNEWRKCFALLDIVNLYTAKMHSSKVVEEEMKKLKSKYEKVIPNEVGHKKCSTCGTMEKRERLHICETCVENKNVDWKGMEEEEILHAILCAHCCMKEHSGHKFVDYLPWKEPWVVLTSPTHGFSRNLVYVKGRNELKQLLLSTVTDGKHTVSSMDDICSYEVEKGKEELAKWNKEMTSFSSIQLNSYREGISIADSLQLESDLVTRFSEGCLPPLRKYRKVVTDSTSRLLLLKEGVNEGKVDIGRSQSSNEEVTALLTAPSQIDILKREYEATIGKLEQKLEDKEKKLKESSEVFKNMEMVHCKRLPQIETGRSWIVEEGTIDRLNFTVSHPMTLIVVEMYLACQATEMEGILSISTSEGEILLRQEYPLWHGTREYSKKIVLKKPVELSPQKTYLVEMRVGGASKLVCGQGGVAKNNLPSGHLVTFTPFVDGGGSNGTLVANGQFPGFYFWVGHQ